MNKQEQIEKMMLDVPQTIAAYDANPKGQHLYGEQRLQIAEILYDKGYGDVSEYEAEIERLEAENEKLLDSIESVQAGRCRLRCPLTEQAVKEFAERLKKYSYTDNCFKDGKWHRYVLVDDIEKLIEEVGKQ